jgi:hypothetical protein
MEVAVESSLKMVLKPDEEARIDLKKETQIFVQK